MSITLEWRGKCERCGKDTLLPIKVCEVCQLRELDALLEEKRRGKEGEPAA